MIYRSDGEFVMKFLTALVCAMILAIGIAGCPVALVKDCSSRVHNLKGRGKNVQ